MINVRLKNIEVRYPRTTEAALRLVELDLDAGEILAVVGMSGSGKSTLLRTVAGFIRRRDNQRSRVLNSLIVPRDYAPLTGTVFFNGQDVSDLSPRSRRVAFTTQALNLYPNMTVYENIAFPLRMAHTDRDEIKRRVEGIAHRLQIERLLQRRPNELSGGEQQRVALGKALVQDANVYLFDEPLSSIDAPLRSAFRKDLRVWLREPRRTAFYVTHDMDEAFAIADRVAVLNQGEMLQVATPSELYNYPNSLTVAKLVWGGRTTVLSGEIDKSCVRIGSTILDAHSPGSELPGSKVWIAAPREAFKLTADLTHGSSIFEGEVVDIRFAAASYIVDVRTSGFSVEVAVNGAELPAMGKRVTVSINADQLRLFPKLPNDVKTDD
jgi:ABC-type sugar transport system ATPase subunit